MTENQNDLPAPLSPPECDLRGYDFMPLFGHRMFRSTWYSLALQNPRAGLAAQKLWWEAWQQCPAGSLPNDENYLAFLADFGKNLKNFRKIREIALHGFIECSDGRLYHPLLCQEAQSAYIRRTKERERKAKYRNENSYLLEKSQNISLYPAGQDADKTRKSPSLSTGQDADKTRKSPSPSMGQDAEGTRDGTGTSASCPEAVPCDRTGQDRTGQQQPREARPLPAAAGSLDFGFVIKPDRDTGEPTVNGYLLNNVGEQCMDAAGMDSARSLANFRPVGEWLRDGYDGNEIPNVVAKCAARSGYKPPNSLAYFNKPVRDQCPMDPLWQRQ